MMQRAYHFTEWHELEINPKGLNINTKVTQGYLSIFIRRVTLITESDTDHVFVPPYPPDWNIRGVKSWYAQLVQLKG